MIWDVVGGGFVLSPGSKGLELREHGMLRELIVEGLKHTVQAGVMWKMMLEKPKCRHIIQVKDSVNLSLGQQRKEGFWVVPSLLVIC